jgi:hypothetical protein
MALEPWHGLDDDCCDDCCCDDYRLLARLESRLHFRPHVPAIPPELHPLQSARTRRFPCADPDGHDPDGVIVYCPPCATREVGDRHEIAENYVRLGPHRGQRRRRVMRLRPQLVGSRCRVYLVMSDDNAFTLTLVRVGRSLPYVDVAAYEYLGTGLPGVGDTITIRRILGPGGGEPHETRAYVTRVDGNTTPPIRATELSA